MLRALTNSTLALVVRLHHAHKRAESRARKNDGVVSSSELLLMELAQREPDHVLHFEELRHPLRRTEAIAQFVSAAAH